MTIDEPRTFLCAKCKNEFEIDENWGEEEKLGEMRKLFGDLPKEKRASVCTECYNKLIANFN